MLRFVILLVIVSLSISCKTTKGQKVVEVSSALMHDEDMLEGLWFKQPTNEEMSFVKDKGQLTPSRFMVTWSFDVDAKKLTTRTPGPDDKPKNTMYTWAMNKDGSLSIDKMGDFEILQLDQKELKLK